MSAEQKIKIIDDLSKTFDNTPVVCVNVRYKNKHYAIYGKYEAVGFTGSLKDRMARHIMRCGYKSGFINSDCTITECSSGNTAIALSSLCRLLGNPVEIFMPDWMSEERFKILNLIGAKIHKISRDEGGFIKAVQMAKEAGKVDGHYCISQFDNPMNIDAHCCSTAFELLNFIDKIGIEPSCFVAGVGTGAVVMAFAKLGKIRKMRYTSHPLEPYTTPILTGSIDKFGNHRIEGIADDFLPALINLNVLDAPITIDDGDAILMARKICKSGISFGISAGANLVGSIKKLSEIPDAESAITIFCDTSLKYLSTDLVLEEKMFEHYISADTEIVDVSIIRDK